MEFNTCEEYVLAELESAQNATLTLSEEVERLETENQLLRERLEAKPDQFEKAIADAGRKRLFEYCTNAYTSVMDGDDVIPFKDWCLECVLSYGIPKGVSKSQFVDAFEPEFLESYNERLAEESED